MKAVYIVNNSKVAKTLIDPMRRAILDLLRQKPMTQAQMADELGLSSASLNYHIKILRSRKLVVVAKREYERHGIKQIFFLAAAYLFVYDLDLLPKSIARYFCPVSLERARSAISLLIMNNRNNSIDQTPDISNSFAEILSRQLVKVAKAYVEKQVNHAQESIIYEIYTKAMSELLDMKKNSLLSKEIALNLHNR
ncbi:MAG TPA: helix-turn-helix domain-containing protein [Candidatus Eisenbacteria bacterium]|nr:helix-turn-helix domain-containing protein [Candidatus Eisenbacteria bacterium]